MIRMLFTVFVICIPLGGCYTGVEESFRRAEDTRELTKFGYQLESRLREHVPLEVIITEIRQPADISIHIHDGRLKSLEKYVLLVPFPEVEGDSRRFLLLKQFANDQRLPKQNQVIVFDTMFGASSYLLSNQELQVLLEQKDPIAFSGFLTKMRDQP